MQAIQNLGLAVVPIVAGYIVDHNGYLMLEVFFLAMLCLALIAGRCSIPAHNVSSEALQMLVQVFCCTFWTRELEGN